jgi:ribosome recycling factor
MSKKYAYIAKMELHLDKLNTQMGELEAKAQEAKEEARSNYKEEMSKLRHKSKLALAKLEELKAASEDSWETMVADMEKMHDVFTHSFFSLFQVPTASSSSVPGENFVRKGSQAV